MYSLLKYRDSCVPAKNLPMEASADSGLPLSMPHDRRLQPQALNAFLRRFEIFKYQYQQFTYILLESYNSYGSDASVYYGELFTILNTILAISNEPVLLSYASLAKLPDRFAYFVMTQIIVIHECGCLCP